jgi:hypothetical protein
MVSFLNSKLKPTAARKMKLATNHIVLEGLNREKVDFRKVETIDQLKDTIISNYVVVCRNCASDSFCKFYDRSEPPCPILERIVRNYVDMNIKSINTENSHSLSEFISSVIVLIQIFNAFENWRGIYADEFYNWFFESAHPGINSFYSHDILKKLSRYLDAYRVVDIEHLKKFIVFLEGDSEYEALPSIF